MTEKSPLEHFATAILQQFGVRAVEIAEEQLRAVSGDALLAWNEIVTYLRNRVSRFEDDAARDGNGVSHSL